MSPLATYPLVKVLSQAFLQALSKFPWLINYADLWVVNDLIRCRLQLQHVALKKKSNAILVAEARARASRVAALEAAAAALK